MADPIISDLQSLVEFIVASIENSLLQINTQQCKFLAKEASESLHILGKFEEVLQNQGQESIASTLAAKELHRVLKDAKTIITDCCDDRWLKVIITRGSMKEAFQALVYNIHFYTLLLNSTLIIEGNSAIVFETTLCNGQLDIADSSSLSAAAKQDQDSIRVLLKRLKGDHICDGELCIRDLNNQQCLAARYLNKMDGEEHVLADSNLSLSKPFLYVHPQEFTGKGRVLGGGSFGTVKEREWMGEKYAVKKFSGEGAIPDFEKEIAALAGLNHPNIVQVVGCFEKENSVGIIMELMYKSLYDVLKDHRTDSTCIKTPFTIIQAVDLMLQIAEGVRYIHDKNLVHDKGLVHYDLKSLNILLQFADSDQIPKSISNMDISKISFTAKISDFGLATLKNESTGYSHQTHNKGTSAWMAPELFKMEPRPTRVQPRKLDVYSFGIMCYEILSGDEPYANRSDLMSRVKKGERPQIPRKTPMILSCLIKRCWSKDPCKRPIFSTICQELRYIKGLLIKGDISTSEQSTSYLDNVKMFGSYIRTTSMILLDTFQVRKANIEKQCTSMELRSYLSKLEKSGMQKYNDGEFEKASVDFDAAYNIEPNNAFTLQMRGVVKKILKDFDNALKDLDRADELDGNNCFIKIHRGEVKQTLRDFEGALVDFDDANALAPDHSIILAQRGAVKLELGCFVEALEDLNRAHELNPTDFFILQHRGIVMHELEDFEAALQNFNMAHILLPTDSFTLCCRAVTRRKMLDLEGSLEDLNMAYNIGPLCAFILKNRGETNRILCRYDNALKDLIRANELQPNDAFTLSIRGTVYKELKDFHRALKDLQSADTLDSNNCFIKIQLGEVKRCLRDYKGALVALNYANALLPNHAIILAQLGAVKLEMLHFVEALEDLNKANKLSPENVFVYQQRGVVRRELGDLEGALVDLNMAHSIMPKDPYTLHRRGVTRRELLDYRGSLEDLNMADILQPYTDLTLNERGVTKKVLGDFRGALEDLNMANHIKGYQAFTLKHRGSANRELGNLDEALQDLICANHLEPNDFFTLLELGMTKKLTNYFSGALIHYEKVVEMKPNDPSILQQRGSLKRMLGDFKGALEDFNMINERQTKLYENTIPTMMERCFTKHAMKDIAGAFEDAKLVRELLGVHGLSSIKGEQLKTATLCPLADLSKNAYSRSQSLKDIEKSTPSHFLWIMHQDLRFVKSLGRGSFGYVHKCKWVGENKEVAVKFVPLYITDAFEYEVRMFAKIQHPYVVRLIGCSYDDEEKAGLLVMELMQQNLRSLIDSKWHEKYGPPFDLPVAMDIMAKIAEAMEYLHDQGMLHRDLKSSNVLVNKIGDGKEEYVVKIADFGMAKLQRNNMPYSMTGDVGALLWRAPEVFKNDVCQKYSFPADVWSYGITCYEILSGKMPFEGIPCSEIRHQVLCGLRPELPASCPGTLKSMLMKCWSLVPYERPSFSSIVKLLNLYLGTTRNIRDIRLYKDRRHTF